MKTPSLEEVKAYFKDAKEVRSIYGSKFILNDLSLIGFSNLDFADGIYYNDGEYKIYDTETKTYAEIISYKDKTNESAKKNPEVKQYKHIPTGNIVKQSINKKSYYCEDWEGYFIPREIVENSSDWEEVITKPVLFLTEDGVEIRKGDKFYVVDEQYGKFKMHDTIGGHFTKEHKHRKRFSNREKASEYVLRNKPCLSVNDVVYGTKKAFVNNEAMSALVELAKSKISDQQ